MLCTSTAVCNKYHNIFGRCLLGPQEETTIHGTYYDVMLRRAIIVAVEKQ
jgi:hypothetical protein